ncbi:MAG: L-threonylcarbamoyladenylate synthase [Actinomycetota bacterium]
MARSIVATPDAVAEVARAIADGQLVVIPTDTVYGLVSALTPDAVLRVFAAKRRELGKPIAVLAGSMADAEKLAVFDHRAKRAAAQGWPGALTLVLPAGPTAERIEGVISETVGIRIPDHQFASDLLRLTGPLPATSANISGVEPVTTIEEAIQAFGETVGLYVDGGELSGAPSKVISMLGPPRTIRD